MMKEDGHRFVMDSWGSTRQGLEDGRRLASEAWGSARQGLGVGHERLASDLLVQATRARVAATRIRERFRAELLPEAEQRGKEAWEQVADAGRAARDTVAALYDAHLAPIVAEHVTPLLEQHVQPVIDQQILPQRNFWESTNKSLHQRTSVRALCPAEAELRFSHVGTDTCCQRG